jgi:antitoxin CptB
MMRGAFMSASHKDETKKRLSYRAWHRGTKEMDLILGRFADKRLESLSPEELKHFERLISYPDTQLYLWITGREPIPVEADSPLLQEIRMSATKPKKP